MLQNCYVSDIAEQFAFAPYTDQSDIVAAEQPIRIVSKGRPGPLETASAGIIPVSRQIPIDRTVGGEMAATSRLAWTVGIRPDRWAHGRFTGETVVIHQPPMAGANSGPVGMYDRQGRLAAAVASQYTEYTPNSEQVATMFTVQPHSITAELMGG